MTGVTTKTKINPKNGGFKPPFFSLEVLMKLELFYYDQCPFCARTLQKIKGLGIEDRIEFRNTLEDPSNREEHVKRSGRGTVPCLYIDGKPMFESADIMNWLEENKDKI